MKKIILGLILFVVFAAHADTKVLTPEKNGTPNKIYSESQAPQLTIANYNMAAARVSDLSTLAKAIKAMNADIISLNEVDKNTQRSGKVDQVAELAKLTGMHAAFGKAIDFEGGEYGVALLSKYPIDKQQVFPLPSGDGEQRVLLVTQIQVPHFDSPIIMMSTHLDWQEDPTIRLQQIREIENVTIGNTDSSFNNIASSIKLLAGDFNDTYNGPAIRELERYWNPLVVEGADMRTWPAANPALDLDHLFAFRGQQWKIEELTVPNKKAEWKAVNWPVASDHIPVIVKMKLLEQ